MLFTGVFFLCVSTLSRFILHCQGCRLSNWTKEKESVTNQTSTHWLSPCRVTELNLASIVSVCVFRVVCSGNLTRTQHPIVQYYNDIITIVYTPLHIDPAAALKAEFRCRTVERMVTATSTELIIQKSQQKRNEME